MGALVEADSSHQRSYIETYATDKLDETTGHPGPAMLIPSQRRGRNLLPRGRDAVLHLSPRE